MSVESNKKQARFFLRYALQSFGALLLLAILMRFFLFSSYAMSGSSMSPSVLPGDFLVGFKWRVRHLERGEVVVLRCPNSKERICMRRVVALEGDRVEFPNGQLVVNGRPSVSGDGIARDAQLKPVIVPPQHVYLLNDRRSELDDSRVWDSVPIELIEARLGLIWISFEWIEAGQVRSWPRLRWERILRTVH